jgi:structure-specific recognition protein 1
MRLYIPTKYTENEEKEKEEEDNGVINHSAETIKDEILKMANVGSLGDAIAVLSEITIIAPRGKFDIQMLKNVLKIHGPSHDYKIPYNNVTKAFLLPKQDGVHIAIVLALSNPLRQGNTTYQYIVFQFKNGIEKTVNINLPEDENERKSILKSELPSSLTGEEFDIMAKLLKALIGIQIVIPHNFKRYYILI